MANIHHIKIIGGTADRHLYRDDVPNGPVGNVIGGLQSCPLRWIFEKISVAGLEDMGVWKGIDL